MHALKRLRQRYNLSIPMEEFLAVQQKINFGQPILPFDSYGSTKKSALVEIRGRPIPCGCFVTPGGVLRILTALPRMGESCNEAFEEVSRHGGITKARWARPDWQLAKDHAWLKKQVRRIITATIEGRASLPALIEGMAIAYSEEIALLDPGAEPLVAAIAPAALRGDIASLNFLQSELEVHTARILSSYPLAWDIIQIKARFGEGSQLKPVLRSHGG